MDGDLVGTAWLTPRPEPAPPAPGGVAAGDPGWLRPLVGAACSLILAAVATLAAWVGIGVAVLGLEPVAVATGSMAPGIRPGDVVLLDAADGRPPQPGDVVTYRDDRGRLVTHRVTRLADDGSLRTRGDANTAPDPRPVDPGAVVGLGRLLVPAAGLPVIWAGQGRTTHVIGLGLALVAAAAGLVIRPRRRTSRAPAPAGLAPGRAPRGPTPATLPPRVSWAGRRPHPPPAAATASPSMEAAAPIRGGGPWTADRGAGTWTANAGRRARRPRVRAGVLATSLALSVLMGQLPAAGLSGTTSTDGAWLAATLAPPTGVEATGGCQVLLLGPKVDVRWTAAETGDGYEILRATTSGGPYDSVGTVSGLSTTTFTDTSVTAGTTYYYVVRTTDDAWRSPDSAEASATTPGTCV